MKNFGIKTAVTGVILTASLLMTGCSLFPTKTDYTSIGMEDVKMENYSEALEEFQRGINNQENLLMIYRGAGMAYMGLGDYEKAVEAFDAALANGQNAKKTVLADILLYKASAEYKRQEYENVISVCEQVLEQDSSRGDACFLMGSGNLRLGNVEEASADFTKAVKCAPEDYDLYLDIYIEYEGIGQSAEGDIFLQQALDIQDNSEKGHYNRGKIYYYLEQYDAAKTELLEFSTAKYPECMELLGKVYLASDDVEHAISIYQEMIDQLGENAYAFNGLALCNIKQNTFDQALEYISKGLEVDDGSMKKELRFNEIVAYEGKLDFKTAKLKCGEFTARYPGDARGEKEAAFLETR